MRNKAGHNAHYLVRGGQIFLHNLRMISQVIRNVIYLVIIAFILLNGVILYKSISAYDRYLVCQWLIANVWKTWEPHHKQYFKLPNGYGYEVPSTLVVDAGAVKQSVDLLIQKFWLSFLISIVASTLLFVGALFYLIKRGKKNTQSNTVRGDTLVTPQKLRRIIKAQNIDSDLKLAGLPLIRNGECQHFMICGSTGSGKSTAIKYLLDQIRARGDRVIIYDKGCSFLEEFYKENDVLLNPLDVRGAKWHLWRECRDSIDYDNIAAALIPKSTDIGDPFWVDAARAVFSATAYAMKNEEDRSANKLLKYILTAELQNIKKYLEGTFAETLASDKIEKTAISIRAVLATYLKCLKYVEDDPNGFSIREWIQDETQNNWIFITSLGDRHHTLRPLITAWLDIAINSIISLPENDKRRIWFIMDELSSLQVLPSLASGVAEARKFGGCFVMGWQNIAQLEQIYGTKGATNISGLAKTRLIYVQPDPTLAKWSAANLGESIIDEVREGVSYGANSIRDGVSLSRVETRKSLVSFSEIMSLGNYRCFIRLPAKLPITELEFPYKNWPKIHKNFVMREFDAKQSKEVDDLVEKHEKPFLRVSNGTTKTTQKKNAKTKSAIEEIAN